MKKLILALLLTAISQNAVASYNPTITNQLSLKSFGLPTGGDDTTLINTILATAKTNHVAAYAPCGNYKHSGVITDDSVTLYGDGACTVFESTNTTTNPNNAIILTGTAPSLSKVKVVSDWIGSRQGTNNSAAVLASNATNASVLNVETSGSASVGIFYSAVTSGTIAQNYVHNTLADGISAVYQSSNIIINDNRVDSTGDDEISVIGYQTDPGPNTYIDIFGNVLSNSGARAITIGGANHVTVTANSIYTPSVLGILVFADSGASTMGSNDVEVTANNLYGVTVCLLAGGIAGYTVNDVTFSNNTCSGVSLTGINIGAGEAGLSGAYTSNIKVVHNNFIGSGSTSSNYGIYFDATNITVDDNFVTGFGLSGITAGFGGNSGFAKVINNHVDSVSLTSPGLYNAYQMLSTGFTRMYFDGNTQSNGSNGVNYFAVFGASDTNVTIGNGNTGDNGNWILPTTPTLTRAAAGITIGSSNFSVAPPTNGAIIQGNVGIGTTSPSSPLNVYSTTASPVFSTTGSNNSYVNIDNQAGGNQSALEFMNAGSTKFQAGKDSSNNFFLYDNSNSSDAFLVYTNGGVQLGESGSGYVFLPKTGGMAIGVSSTSAGQFVLNNASSHAGQATCWTTGGAIGYCTSVVGAGGACTCVGL